MDILLSPECKLRFLMKLTNLLSVCRSVEGTPFLKIHGLSHTGRVGLNAADVNCCSNQPKQEMLNNQPRKRNDPTKLILYHTCR